MGIRIRTDVGLLMDDGAGDRIVGYIDRAGAERNLDGSPRVPGSTGAILGSANEISSSPTGSVAATTVQAAIAELDTEKVAKAGDTMTGRLGIGTAPIATATAQLTLSGGAVVKGASGAYSLNLYYDSGYKYADNGYGWTMYHDGSGSLIFASAPNNSSGAGVAAALSYLMLITNTGNLQLGGGNTVISSERLHRLRVMTIATLSALTPAPGDLVHVSDLGGGPGPCQYIGSLWVRLKETGQQTIATDAALSLAYLTNAPTIVHSGTLTADRAVTLPTTNVPNGARFHIARIGGGAFNLNVNASTTKALTTNAWCTVEYSGSAWTVIAAGSL